VIQKEDATKEEFFLALKLAVSNLDKLPKERNQWEKLMYYLVLLILHRRETEEQPSLLAMVNETETAFVAVRREAGKQVEGSVAVANALPVGWSEDFLSVSRRMYRAGRIFTSVAQPVEYMELAQPVLCCRMAAVRPSTPRASVSMMREIPAAPPPSKTTVLFSGVPKFADGESILFDTSRKQDAAKLPDNAVINRLEVRFPDGTPEHDILDGLNLLIFVDVLSSPKAKVQLADVVRLRGERPLNILRRTGQVVRLVLLDSTGAWTQKAPRIEVALGWKAMGGG